VGIESERRGVVLEGNVENPLLFSMTKSLGDCLGPIDMRGKVEILETFRVNERNILSTCVNMFYFA
jgi:hypothetical protein